VHVQSIFLGVLDHQPEVVGMVHIK
jgi:hypothetical protein